MLSFVAQVVRPRVLQAVSAARPMVRAGLDRSLQVVQRSQQMAQQQGARMAQQGRQAVAHGEQFLQRPAVARNVGRVQKASALMAVGGGVVAVYDFTQNSADLVKGKSLEEIDWDKLFAETAVLGVTVAATVASATPVGQAMSVASRVGLGVGESAAGLVRDLTVGGKTAADVSPAGRQACVAGVASAVLGEVPLMPVVGGMVGLYAAGRSLQDSRMASDVCKDPALVARWLDAMTFYPDDMDRIVVIHDPMS